MSVSHKKKKKWAAWIVLIVGMNLVPLAASGYTGDDCADSVSPTSCHTLSGKLIQLSSEEIKKAEDGAAAATPSVAKAEKPKAQIKPQIELAKKKPPQAAPKPAPKAEVVAPKAVPAKGAPAPAPAPAAKAAEPAKPLAIKAEVEAPAVLTPSGAAHDVHTTAELQVLFNKNFDIATEGQDPNASVKLYGMIFSDCAKLISISNQASTSDTTGRVVGFRITDNGGAVKCMQAHQDAKDECAAAPSALECTRLSTLDGAKLKLDNVPDAQIGLIYHDLGVDRPNDPWVSISQNPIVHLSRASIQDRIRAQQEEKNAAREALLRNELRGCRNSAADLVIARAARDELSRRHVLGISDLDEINRQLTLAELNIIARDVDRAPSPEDLTVIRERLHAWSDENPGNEEKAVVVFHKIAIKYASAKGAGTNGYDLAADTITEAQSLPDLSGRTQATLGNYQNDIAFGKVSEVAKYGLQGNILFRPYYAALIQKLQSNVASADSLESYASATASLQSAMQLPTRASQVDQQRAQLQQQLQQAMAQANGQLNGQMGGQQFGQPGAMPGQFGVQQQPFAMNGMGGMNSGMPGMYNSSYMPGAMPGMPGAMSGMPGQMSMMPGAMMSTGPAWAGGSYSGAPGSNSAFFRM